MKQCIFCGSTANSKEHVISKRLAKRMRISDKQITVAALTESRGYKERKRHPLLSYEVRCVCKTCNSGWMNALEAFIEESVGSLIEPKWPPSDIYADGLHHPIGIPLFNAHNFLRNRCGVSSQVLTQYFSLDAVRARETTHGAAKLRIKELIADLEKEVVRIVH